MSLTARVVSVALALAVAAPAHAIDEAHKTKASEMTAKAISYLRSQQDPATGGWAVPAKAGAPAFPAISALVLNGMLMEPGIDIKDDSVARGVKFILSYRQPDGGIYDRILPSYNTSIALSMLASVDSPEAKAAIKPAQDFLRSLQYSESSLVEGPAAGDTKRIDPSHPYYGGIGYGNHGRPDLSNLSFMLEALHDSGVPEDDEAFKRALVFISRLQMLDSVNDMAYADGSRQGGFIYSPGKDKDNTSAGENEGSGMIEETLDDGTKVSRFRAYGSMSYAGFKSYIYAQLPRDDVRVRAALDWIRRNYTLEENPGLKNNGMYYYLVMFSRALDAWGDPTLDVVRPGAAPEKRDWANDLIDRLAALQSEDGSFRSVDKRWMEDNQVLITAYALVALQHAAR